MLTTITILQTILYGCAVVLAVVATILISILTLMIVGTLLLALIAFIDVMFFG